MTDTERKEVACYAIKRGNRIVAISPEKATCEALRHGDDESIVEGWFSTKRHQDNNLVPLDEIECGDKIMKVIMNNWDGGAVNPAELYGKIMREISKFGKDNSGITCCSCPIDMPCDCGYDHDLSKKFSQQPPKERKVSLEQAYEIFMEGCFFGKGENVSSDATVIFTQRSTLDEEGIKERLTAILSLLNAVLDGK